MILWVILTGIAGFVVSWAYDANHRFQETIVPLIMWITITLMAAALFWMFGEKWN